MAQITVPYVEMDEEFGLSEGSDEQGGWAKKPYGVAWADRFQFVRDVMGSSSQSGGIAGSWNRKFPLAYPEDTNLFARSVEIKPQGKRYETTPISYDNAIVTVTFRAPQWSFSSADDPLFLNSFSQDPVDNQGLTYCTQELDFGVEYMQIPATNATYEASGDKVTTPIPRRVTVIRMTLTWHDLPYMPLGKIQKLVDRLNNAKFLGCDRGTVLIEGGRTTRERMADGTVTQKFTLGLKWREHDWNEVLLPDGTWDTIIFDNNSVKTVLLYDDFSPLLLIGSGQ